MRSPAPNEEVRRKRAEEIKPQIVAALPAMKRMAKKIIKKYGNWFGGVDTIVNEAVIAMLQFPTNADYNKGYCCQITLYTFFTKRRGKWQSLYTNRYMRALDDPDQSPGIIRVINEKTFQRPNQEHYVELQEVLRKLKTLTPGQQRAVRSLFTDEPCMSKGTLLGQARKRLREE